MFRRRVKRCGLNYFNRIRRMVYVTLDGLKRGLQTLLGVYTVFHQNLPTGISGCRKKRSNNGTFFCKTTITAYGL